MPRKRPTRRANNTGSVFPRADGSWEARVQLPRDPADPTGRRKTVSRRARTKASAKTKLADLLDAAADPTETERLRADGRTTLRVYATERWAPSLDGDVADGRLRAKTASDTLFQLNRHVLPTLGSRALSTIRPSDAQALSARLAADGLALNTRRLVLLSLRKVLLAAAADRLYPEALAKAIAVPRPPTATEARPAPTDEQMRLLAGQLITDASAGNASALLCLLGATTAARRGELVGARFDDFDHRARTWSIQRSVTVTGGTLFTNPTKTGKPRQVTVDDAVLALVAKARLASRPGQQHLAETVDGAPFHPDRISAYYRTRARALGAPEGLHGLRRHYLTAFLSATGDIAGAAEIAGHASVETTRRHYIAADPERQRSGAEAVVAKFWPTAG